MNGSVSVEDRLATNVATKAELIFNRGKVIEEWPCFSSQGFLSGGRYLFFSPTHLKTGSSALETVAPRFFI